MTEGLPEPIVTSSLGRQVIHPNGRPEDVAGGVLMLAGDDAGWTTGQAITANGGNAFSLWNRTCL
jgi:NAD(P)-dependent dehydrogenase (short-subunit alcohol dehydrogenase family)